jgi:hypothetical protein
MSNETRGSRQKVSSCDQNAPHFIRPLNKTSTLDEMNASFGPRTNRNKWDFHDGIDLPAPP